MHSLLEQYLNEVASRIEQLPMARRSEELREMRQHLLNAVIVSREMGQDEDDAAATAVAQCGSSKEAAEGIVRAWQRGMMLTRRDFWGAAACTLATAACLDNLYPLLPDRWVTLWATNHPWPLGADAVVLAIASDLLTGVTSGMAFPRRAIAGAAAACGLRLVWFLLNVFLFLALPHPNHQIIGVPAQLIYMAASGCITVLAAFLASRRRNTRPGRVAA